MLSCIPRIAHTPSRSFSTSLRKHGLTFGRWIKQAPYSLRCGVMANIPQATRMARLSLPEQYAAIELFRGTMARHSVVVYRNDSSCVAQQISFAGDAWLDYVPIRMPETICVQDRLPGKAAAVLINQSHTYRDLLLPINATEKKLFDAVDGKSSIRELVEKTLPRSQAGSQLALARGFFEQLWWYDQVVFDASRH